MKNEHSNMMMLMYHLDKIQCALNIAHGYVTDDKRLIEGAATTANDGDTTKPLPSNPLEAVTDKAHMSVIIRREFLKDGELVIKPSIACGTG